jgi:hypothetical protein
MSLKIGENNLLVPVFQGKKGSLKRDLVDIKSFKSRAVVVFCKYFESLLVRKKNSNDFADRQNN